MADVIRPRGYHRYKRIADPMAVAPAGVLAAPQVLPGRAPGQTTTMISTPIEQQQDWARGQVMDMLPVIGDVRAYERGDYPGLIAGMALSAIPGGRAGKEAAEEIIDIAGRELPKIKAFHGSPHDFDQFSLSKIGTGEGAQAYGHGLYFAGNEGVARSYRDTLAANVPWVRGDATVLHPEMYNAIYGAVKAVPNTHQDQAGQVTRLLIQAMADQKTAARVAKNYEPPKGFEAQWNAGLAALGDVRYRNNPGSMYEVSISASPDDLLDWDKPLSQQSEKVRQAVGAMIDDYRAEWHDMSTSGGGRTYNEWTYSSPGGSNHGGVFETPKGWEAYIWRDGKRKTLGTAGSIDNARQMVMQNVTPSGLEGRHGQSAYEMLSDRFGSDDAAAQALREAGIPGIKYLDAGSRNVQLMRPDETVHGEWLVKQIPNGKVLYRGADEAAARAAYDTGVSNNYVIFDDSLIDIIRKYGIAGLALPGLGALATNGGGS